MMCDEEEKERNSRSDFVISNRGRNYQRRNFGDGNYQRRNFGDFSGQDDGGDQRERRRHVGLEEDDILYKRKRHGSDTVEDEIMHKLTELLTHVGEKNSSSLESNLESLAQVLETDLDTYKEHIIDILVKCLCSMPNKLTIYSTLVGLLNAKKYNFGAELLDKLLSRLNELMKTNDFDHALYVVRRDWFVYVFLHCLPWVGQELAEKNEEQLSAMLDIVESYLQSRNKEHVKILQVWMKSIHEQEEYLDCLWAQIVKLRSDKWKEKFITRHYVAFDGTLADALQHSLPSFEPPPHTTSSIYPLPSVVFRFFDYADCPDDGPVLPGAHSIERFLVEEELRWILDQEKTNRKKCASRLLEYDKRTLVPLNYVILEVIFSQLFHLPEAPTRLIFYGSLLIELCKTKSMPQVIAQAAEIFYQRIDSMQVACIDRLIDWFSYHMSNFEYRWSWSDWSDCIELDRLAPKHMFVREVLDKCMRLSYHQRLTEFLPAAFEKMIPQKPIISYDLNDDEHPDRDFAIVLEKAFREKISADGMIDLLRNQSENQMDINFRLSIFFKVLLYLARKTFSHNFVALTRYYSTLKELIGGREDVQLTILRTLYEIWKLHGQMIIVLVTKLLKMSLVDASAVVAWLFSDEMKPEFERLWIWEILNIALEHVSGHVRRNRQAIENAKLKKEEKELNDEKDDFDMETNEHDDMADPNAVESFVKESEFADLHECLKNLLLDVLHKFTVTLTEHIVNSESNGNDFQNNWYLYVTGRFKNVFLKYWRDLFEFREALEKELFKEFAIDSNVMENYNQFKALMT
uniref:Nuclear cap-binding protein subunit 1 n=2 Tax=Brugia malayi TaxID=6279 RepID=A0A1I9FZR3_BRUMA|nr:Bm3900, isoform h [Brugia malayi]